MSDNPSGYRVQPATTAEDLTTELRQYGINRPAIAGDHMDETMHPELLRVVVQIGLEHLAKLGGAETGDILTAALVNRGLVAYMRKREADLKAWAAEMGA